MVKRWPRALAARKSGTVTGRPSRTAAEPFPFSAGLVLVPMTRSGCDRTRKGHPPADGASLHLVLKYHAHYSCERKIRKRQPSFTFFLPSPRWGEGPGVRGCVWAPRNAPIRSKKSRHLLQG